MTNAFSLFRSLVIYGICLPVAIFIGYLLATPEDFTTYTALALLMILLSLPLFMRYHYPLLVFFWNASAGLYFLPGKPSFCLILIFVSFSFSFLAYIMNRDLKFISAPSLARPLLFLAAVIIITAYFNGGIGLNILGSEVSGGKRYILLLAGVPGYFAITAQRISLRKGKLYSALFFGGYLISTIGNIFYIISPSLYFLIYIFPTDVAEQTSLIDTGSGITRLGALSAACVGGVYLVLAVYGIKGILNMRKIWRLLIILMFMVVSLFGGYRSKAIEIMLVFAVLFYLEGLMRTRLLPAVILAAIFSAAVVLPFAEQLPLSVQRSLTFLPLKLNPEAELNAQASTDWRVAIWTAVVPTIPQYLFLGKGLAMDAGDLDMMRAVGFRKNIDGGSGAGAALAGDYHNGPLSVIVPFGLGGTIGFIWFLIASFKALINNNRYGDPENGYINRILLAYFTVRAIMFFFVVGSFYSDLVVFTGAVGFSLAINGGIRVPLPQTSHRPVMSRFKLANAAR